MFIQMWGREVTSVKRIADKHNLDKKGKQKVYDIARENKDLHIKIIGRKNKEIAFDKIGEKLSLSKSVLLNDKQSFHLITREGYEKWLLEKENKCEKPNNINQESEYLQGLIDLINERDNLKEKNIVLEKENSELKLKLNKIVNLVK